ncbi:transmembrane protein 70, mitochondrial [Myripristis murdjan]|uniref:Transmembrane protein 70 n=1 Tax=Myripristis murdjan TaxID=586833 RepID=A0A668AFH5_9TELE|nr:transmembrane protein 70, mitochondrial [Myripristis murdjan]
MFPLNISRRFRPCIVSQVLSGVHPAAPPHGRRFSAAAVRAVPVPLQALRAGTRSFLQLSTKVESRCLSTSSSSEEGNLIYTGSLGTAVRGVKMFSYTSSGASLCLMPHVMLNSGLALQSLPVQAAFCGIIGFFTFLTPVLLHLVTKGYVVRLYHKADSDTYTAVTYNFLLMEKRTVFQQRQVRIPEVSKMFTTFYADKTGLLVNPDLFPLAHDYNHLMGYDQPFTFDTDDLERPDKS